MEYADEYKYKVLHKQLLSDKSKVAEMVSNDSEYLTATNSIGQTALEYFASLDNYDNVILLGTLGGTVTPSALRDICSRGTLEMVELLLPFCDDATLLNCIDMLTREEIEEEKYQLLFVEFRRFGYELKAKQPPISFDNTPWTMNETSKEDKNAYEPISRNRY